jgi:phenylacetate-CoA ligase
MRYFISKYIGLPIQDLVKKTKIKTTYEKLLLSQYWNENEIENYQVQKLKKLLNYANNNVPYYRYLFKEKKINLDDFHNLHDLNKIPILTKEILRQNNSNLLSERKDKYIKVGKTGGTTGTPVKTYKDRYDRSFAIAAYYRWFNWMGVSIYDSVLTLWGASSVLSKSKTTILKEKIIKFLLNNARINTFKFNEKTMASVLKEIINKKPHLLKGYLSSILQLADYITDNNLDLDFGFKAISTTTESLLPHHRKHIQKNLHAPVFDQYGCGEVGAIAFECDKHQGLHINKEHVIVEVLNDQDVPITEGTGRLVVTNLDNLIMPIIRYENGDIVTITTSKCTCGVNHELITSIDGRSTDTLILKNGNKVHGVFITDVFYELNLLSDKISRFQVFQNKPGEIEIRFERKDNINGISIKLIEGNLLKFFNVVKVKILEHLLLEKNGKFKYIISDIKE